MKILYIITLIFIAGFSQAENSTIEELVADYEIARKGKSLEEWRVKNTHPMQYKNISELQKQWKKISSCHDELHQEKRKRKDAKRPAHVKLEIKEANASTFDGMYYYPITPEKKIRLIYPKGSFIKGTGFYVSKYNDRWYRVLGLYTDQYINKYLRTKEHYIYELSPSCFSKIT